MTCRFEKTGKLGRRRSRRPGRYNNSGRNKGAHRKFSTDYLAWIGLVGNRAVAKMGREIADRFDWSGESAATHNHNGFGATRCEVLDSLIGYQHHAYCQHSILQLFFPFALKFAPRFRMSRKTYEDVRSMTIGNIYALPRKANLVYSQSGLADSRDAVNCG